MSEPTYPVPLIMGPDGLPMARVSMSLETNHVRSHVEAPPDQAIPIVFLPGIMGSPLVATGDNRGMVKNSPWAWFPDKPLTWVAGVGNSYRNLSPADRKRLLDPEQTRALELDEGDAEIVEAKLHDGLPIEEAMRRGWGSVSLDSYAEILNYLELNLQTIVSPSAPPSAAISAAIRADIQDWGVIEGSHVPLDAAALTDAAEFRYPVFAAGYNWLRSCGDAATFLSKRVVEILADCRDRLGVKCEHGVILVTHSMGGLVARRLSQLHPELVQGVVHGVQPAVGAATAYRRVRAGWEDFSGALGLGWTGFHITPVFANAAGPLELLPSKRYGTGWLRARERSTLLFELPHANGAGEADPYMQIYLQQDAWWRLVDPRALDPHAEDVGPDARRALMAAAWLKYAENIAVAKDFHDAVNDHYHPRSFATYGGDEGRRAFRNVTWTFSQTPGTARGDRDSVTLTTAKAMKLRLHDEDHEGRLTLFDVEPKAGIPASTMDRFGRTRPTGVYRAQLDEPDQAGDSTVPEHSAQDVRKRTLLSIRMKGYGHQDSYNDTRVQEATLYAILRLGADAKLLGN